MTYKPNIAKKMANGDTETATWLLSASFHKIIKGASLGAWIAWKPGMLAYITSDHPDNLGCCWLDGDGLGTLQDAIAYAEREAL